MSASKKRRQYRRKAEAESLGLTMPEFAALERVLQTADETVAWEKRQQHLDSVIEQKLEQKKLEQIQRFEAALNVVRRQLCELDKGKYQPGLEDRKAQLRARLRELKSLLRQI